MGFWEQLPYTNFHDLNLSELVKFVNETIKKIHEMSHTIEEQNQTIEDFKNYVTDYLENLDVETDIINYINELIDNGTMTDVIKTAINTMDDWTNRNVIYVGDSYGIGQTATPGVFVNGVAHYINAKLQPNSLVNMAVTNARFSDLVAENERFGKQLETYVNGHTTADCEAVTDILIMGGVNDVRTSYVDIVNTTANYCAKWTSDYIKLHFPNARVYLGFINRIPRFYDPDAYTFNKFRDTIDKYREIASKYHWRYVVNSEYMCHCYEELDTDGLHFTQAGYQKIGYRLAEYLNNGSWEYPQEDGSQLTLMPETTSDLHHVIITDTNGHIGMYNQHTESGVFIFTNRGVACNFTSQTVKGDSQIYIGKYYDKTLGHYAKFVNQYDLRYPALFKLFSGGAKVHEFEGWFNFKMDGSVSIGATYGAEFGEITCDQINITLDPLLLPYSVC